MPLMQLGRNGKYAAFYEQSLQTRQVFPPMKSTNKQKKITFLIQPLHLCVKLKISLIPS